jgi:hypothetical protein
LSRKAQFFFPELNIRLYDKNSESDYFFFLHQNQNIFFSNIGNQNIFLELNGRSLIYLLERAICGLQHIGETKQQLSKRLNDHRSDAIANLTFHSADISDRRATMILSAN